MKPQHLLSIITGSAIALSDFLPEARSQKQKQRYKLTQQAESL